MELTALLESIRELYALDEVTYPEDTLTKHINRGIKKISELYPASELDHTHTVKDQTRYTVTHEGLIKLRQIYYRQGFQSIDMFGDVDIQSSVNPSTTLSTFAPSQSVELVARLELLRKIYPSDGVIVDHVTFDLIPTPDIAGDPVYYEYDRYREIDEIPDMFEEELTALMFYYYGEAPAQKALLNPQGNKYFFDRRGNNQVVTNQNELLQSSRKTQFDGIIKGIKNKIALIGA